MKDWLRTREAMENRKIIKRNEKIRYIFFITFFGLASILFFLPFLPSPFIALSLLCYIITISYLLFKEN
jgi:hypothetical protein